MHLTAADVQHFHEEGYLMKPGVFEPADLQRIKDALAARIATAAERLQGEGQFTDTYVEAPFETRAHLLRTQNPTAGDAVLRTLEGKGGGGFSGAAMFDMIRHPNLLDCVQDLVGPEIVGSSVYRVRPKLPGLQRGEVPWHQDSGYLLGHCDKHLIVTCWLPLVDATLENGCLWLLPRAHRQGILKHYTGGPSGFLIIPDDVLPSRFTPIPMPMLAGGVLFMHNLMPHCSYSNYSTVIRWSLDLRYQGADVPNNVDEDPASYTPERDPVTMACYPLEADFVLRSPAHPEREVRTPAAFEAVRQRYENAHPHFPGRGWTPLKERVKKK